MAFRTALTELFGIRHPILLAPMGAVSGGALAAAVSRAGGLGLLGAGYDDAAWIEREFAAADGAAGRHRFHHLASRPPSRSAAGGAGAQAGRGHALVRRSDAVRGADSRCRSAADPAGADARRRARCGRARRGCRRGAGRGGRRPWRQAGDAAARAGGGRRDRPDAGRRRRRHRRRSGTCRRARARRRGRARRHAVLRLQGGAWPRRGQDPSGRGRGRRDAPDHGVRSGARATTGRRASPGARCRTG